MPGVRGSSADCKINKVMELTDFLIQYRDKWTPDKRAVEELLSDVLQKE